MNTLDAGFRLLPVGAELRLAAHRLLRLAQSSLMPLEAVKRRVERAVREGDEAGNAHVDTDRPTLRNGLLNLATVAIAQPAQLWQKQAVVAMIELDLFWVGIAEAIRLALLLEAREVRPLSEEVGVGPLQILERLLQRMHGRIGQPCGFRAIAPLGE